MRDQLLATFDRHGRVEEADRIANEHFDASGAPADLKRTIGDGLRREDAGLHALQNVEAAFHQFEAAESEAERRIAAVATARYLTTHFPTRREREQTVTIARRRFRGESIHGEE